MDRVERIPYRIEVGKFGKCYGKWDRVGREETMGREGCDVRLGQMRGHEGNMGKGTRVGGQEVYLGT